jgi:hypothetical protein
VDTPAAVRPDDLLDALDDWCPGPDARRTLLAEVPEALFGSR